MFILRKICSCEVFATAALLFCINGSVLAFNPQPEPPGDIWRIEGFINMTALEILPTGDAIPFGVDSTIVADSQIDFRVGVVATFTATDSTGAGTPDDGIYTLDMEYFRVQIGDTSWDETMPTRGLQLQIQGGIGTGASGILTDTMPAHPDLEFMFPASPGTWVATDDRDGNNVGSINGIYGLVDGEVSDKPQISVADGFIKLDATNGTAPGDSDCTLPDHYGRMVFDDSNDLLYICSQSGWVTK